MADEKKYIDAMPLISEYERSIEWLKDNVEMMKWHQFTDQMASMQSARKMLLDAPAADVRLAEWISVDDKLPDNEETVSIAILCNGIYFIRNGFFDLQHRTWCQHEEMWAYRPIRFHGYKVTHWMPLPEPPNCGADMREGLPNEK